MSSLSDPNIKIRIAVVLCALKFKPKEQSCGSYVLDLRNKFRVSEVGTEVIETEWRRRALEYEKQLKDLKEAYECDKIELAVLRARPVGPGDHTTVSKKKAKKKTGTTQQQQQQQKSGLIMKQTDLQALLDGIVDRDVVCVSPPSILTILERLVGLSDSLSDSLSIDDTDLGSTISVILGSAKSALAAVSSLLEAVLSKAGSSWKQPAQILNVVDMFLDQLLSTIFGMLGVLLKRCKKGRGKRNKDAGLLEDLICACDKILGALAELILVPVIRAFWKLSQEFMSVSFGKAKEKAVDVRMGLSGILKRSVAVLQAFGNSIDGDSDITCKIQALRQRIVLEAIREIMSIYEPLATISNFRRDEWSIRTRRLARKDTLWLLIDMLNIILGTGNQKKAHGTGALLRDEVLLEKMAEMVRLMGKESEVERNIVLGFVEKEWMDGDQNRNGWTEVEWQPYDLAAAVQDDQKAKTD